MKTKKDDSMKCHLCNFSSENFEITGNFVYGGNSEQKFYRCPHCDVTFLYPPMRTDEEKKFYAKEFEKFMEKRAGADFDWKGPEVHIKTNEKQYYRRLPFFEEFVVPGKRVLEIGCSSGFMLLPLQKKGMRVVGVEPSKGFTAFLTKKNIPVFESIEKLLQSEEGGNKFDLVMHFFVLEHLRDPEEFIKNSLNLVIDGGNMVFEVPSRSDPLISIYNISAFQKFYWSVAHNYYFNRASLEFLLKKMKMNFEIKGEQRYDLSNHFTWALEGKPGGQGRYSELFTPELQAAYRESMIRTGHCDTLICTIKK
jgi:2-polyprenyl-3-methyl-5-hydroxy-6-metoxy-1,4-benzoquinol methylase